MKVRKAVFPVAGIGTRFLPATKANPKEMLPIVDKPLIQYAVEEAISAGINELIFITNGSKRAIEDHFDANPEMEQILRSREKFDLLSELQSIIPDHITCVYVRQKAPLGLGDAVLCARQLIHNEPFAVLLADDLIDGGNLSCMRQMVEVFSETQSSIVAVEEVSSDKIGSYGVVAFDQIQNRLANLTGLVEKPLPPSAPSNLGIVGRYILLPEIFDYLQEKSVGAGGEIQLTDAIAKLLNNGTVNAWQFHGKRYDCGSKIGYLEATMAYALKHDELKEPFQHLLSKMVTDKLPI